MNRYEAHNAENGVKAPQASERAFAEEKNTVPPCVSSSDSVLLLGVERRNNSGGNRPKRCPHAVGGASLTVNRSSTEAQHAAFHYEYASHCPPMLRLVIMDPRQ
jgi:hypothetical protein